jgi:hypothetical protein
MRKILFLIIFFLSYNALLVKADTFFGVRTGVVFSSVAYPSNLIYRNLRPGLSQSIVIENSFKKHFFFGAELLVQQLGNNSYIFIQDSSIFSKKSVSYNLNYITLPLKFGFKTIGLQYFVSSISFWPSLLLSSNYRVYNPVPVNYNLTNTQKYNVGASVEIGYGKRVNSHYSYQVSGNYFHSSNGEIYSHRCFTISVLFKFLVSRNISKSHF